MTKNEKKGILYTLIGASAWGLSGTCGQFLFSYSTIDPRTVTIYRLIGSGLLLIIINLFTNRDKMLDVFKNYKKILHMIIYGIFGVGLCQLSYLSAIKHSNSGTATVLQSTGIILVFAISSIMQKKKPKLKEYICLILVMLGVFLLATHGNISQLVISEKGLIWGALAALAVVLYTLLPGNLMNEYGTAMILGYSMLIGGIVMFFVLGDYKVITDTRPITFLCIFLIIAIGTALAFTFYLKGVQLCGAKMASMLSSAEPIVATLSAWLVLGTAFEIIDFIGFAVVIVGVLLLSSK